MTINRQVFYDNIRNSPFPGSLAPERVEGMDRMLDYWESRLASEDPRWLANIFAQTFHETGARMVPVREGFATTDGVARKVVRNRPYGVEDNGHVYYGRGLIQITWAKNYASVGEKLGLGSELLDNPDLALDPQVALDILFHGMIGGWFTGVGLDRFFNEVQDNPLGARKIVNGTDKDALIAGYHIKFLEALKLATAPAPVRTTPAPPATAAPMGKSPDAMYPEDKKPVYRSKTALTQIGSTVSGAAITGGTVYRQIDPKGTARESLFSDPIMIVVLVLGLAVIGMGGYLLYRWLKERDKL